MNIENPATLSDPILNPLPESTKVNWRQVLLFLGLTFFLTWFVDGILYLKGGLIHPAAVLVLQFQMLLPAFSAMILGLFVFKNSPVYFKTNHATSRWFVWFFLVFTLLFAVALTISFLDPFKIPAISSMVLIPSILGLLLLIVLRVIGKKAAFSNTGMGFGATKYWLWFGLGILALSALQTGLNWIFKLGKPVDLGLLLMQFPSTGMSLPVLMVVLAAQTILIGPFLGLIVTFGEEYGWRGYLQPALLPLGKIKAILLLGVIWGIWHWPVIWMGYNYPGHPILGSLLMVLFCIGLAFLLGYAVLKSGGVWIAAFLHALVNQSFAFFMAMVYTPNDAAHSFGIGWPGFLVVVVLILLILRDPLWREKPSAPQVSA